MVNHLFLIQLATLYKIPYIAAIKKREGFNEVIITLNVEVISEKNIRVTVSHTSSLEKTYMFQC